MHVVADALPSHQLTTTPRRVNAQASTVEAGGFHHVLAAMTGQPPAKSASGAPDGAEPSVPRRSGVSGRRGMGVEHHPPIVEEDGVQVEDRHPVDEDDEAVAGTELAGPTVTAAMAQAEIQPVPDIGSGPEAPGPSPTGTIFEAETAQTAPKPTFQDGTPRGQTRSVAVPLSSAKERDSGGQPASPPAKQGPIGARYVDATAGAKPVDRHVTAPPSPETAQAGRGFGAQTMGPPAVDRVMGAGAGLTTAIPHALRTMRADRLGPAAFRGHPQTPTAPAGAHLERVVSESLEVPSLSPETRIPASPNGIPGTTDGIAWEPNPTQTDDAATGGMNLSFPVPRPDGEGEEQVQGIRRDGVGLPTTAPPSPGEVHPFKGPTPTAPIPRELRAIRLAPVQPPQEGPRDLSEADPVPATSVHGAKSGSGSGNLRMGSAQVPAEGDGPAPSSPEGAEGQGAGRASAAADVLPLHSFTASEEAHVENRAQTSGDVAQRGDSSIGPILADRLQHMVAAIVRERSPEGVERVAIQLHPEHLGKLFLHVGVDESGTVHARFIAENPTVRSLIEQDLGQLRAALAEHGLTLGDAGVDADVNSDPGLFAGGFYDQDRPAPFANNGDGGRDAHGTAAAPSPHETDKGQAVDGSLLLGRIDIRV